MVCMVLIVSVGYTGWILVGVVAGTELWLERALDGTLAPAGTFVVSPAEHWQNVGWNSWFVARSWCSSQCSRQSETGWNAGRSAGWNPNWTTG